MKYLTCLKCYKTIKNQDIYGLHTHCFVKWFGLKEGQNETFSDLDPKKTGGSATSSSKLSANITKNENSFYHGRYRKYSAKLEDQQYILKVEESKFPDLPAMEYLCNQIASHLSLKVPAYYLLRFNSSSHLDHGDFALERGGVVNPPKHKQKLQKRCMAFVTKNFMQHYTGGSLHHIYKYLPEGKKHHNCQNIIKVIIKKTNQIKEVEKFIKICLFDSFIGNGDRHGRNLGIIDTRKKRFLAPMYDNPSYFGTEEKMLDSQFNISGCIWTSSSEEPKLKDYIKEFNHLSQVGFKYPLQEQSHFLKIHETQKILLQKIKYYTICLQFIKKIISQFPAIIKEVEYAEISEKRKQAFTHFLNNRLKDLKQILYEADSAKEGKTHA